LIERPGIRWLFDQVLNFGEGESASVGIGVGATFGTGVGATVETRVSATVGTRSGAVVGSRVGALSNCNFVLQPPLPIAPKSEFHVDGVFRAGDW
jgi:hypothetical protein